jgi:hypothetical protein
MYSCICSVFFWAGALVFTLWASSLYNEREVIGWMALVWASWHDETDLRIACI